MANLEKYKDAARKFELKENWQKALEVLVKAIEEFEKQPEPNENDLALFNKVGDLFVKVNDTAKAIQYYERAVDLYSEASLVNPAIALCNKVLRLSPGRSGTYLKLGALFAKKGFAAEAKQNLLEYADRMQKAGQIEEAFRALKKFAEMTPGQDEIWSVLAQQAQAQAKTPEAKAQIDKLLAEFDAKDKASAQRKSRTSRHMVTGEEIKEEPGPKRGELIFLDVGDDIPTPGRSPASRTGTMKAPAPPPPPAPRVSAPKAAPPPEPRVSAPKVAPPPPPEPRVSAPRAAPPPPKRAEPEPLVIEPTSLAPEPASPVSDLPLMSIEPSGIPLETPPMPGLERTGADALDIEHTSLDVTPAPPPRKSAAKPPVPEAPALDLEPPLDEPAAAELAQAGAQDAEPEAELDLGEIEIPQKDLERARASSAGRDLPMIDLGEPAEEEVPSEPAAGALATPVGEVELNFDAKGTPEVDVPSEAEVAQSIEFEDLGTVEEVKEPSLDDLLERVADNPDDWDAHRLYGEKLIEAGDREHGLVELDAAMNGYDAADNLALAETLVEEILRLEPNSVRHQQKRVELAYRSGDRARLVDAYVELADALLRSNEPDKSIAVYQRVLEHDPNNVRARSAIETLAPPEPPQPEPKAAPAKAPAARAPAARAPAAPAPAAPPPEPVPAAAAPAGGGDYVDLGAMLLDEEAPKDTRMRIEDEEPTGDEQQDFQNMLAAFKKGIDANVGDEDFQSHYDLGVAYKEMGLLDEAIAEFQKALRAPDGKLKSSEALGLCFFEKTQYAVAETILKRGLDNPANGDAERVGLLYWLGRTQEELGKEKDALESYNRVFAVDINFQDVNQRVANLGQASAGPNW